MELAAVLAGEPWCFTPAEIGSLTLPQVNRMYFRARDKDGNIRRDPDKIKSPLSDREQFVRAWCRFGVSRERAEELWREKRVEAKKKSVKKRRGRRGK